MTLPRTTAVLALSLLLACEGPMGPEGPRGAEGAQGPQGPEGNPSVVHMDRTQTNPDGDAVLTFPGLQAEEAVITCYVSDSSGGPWLVIGTDTASGITCGAQNSGNDLEVAVINAPANWWFMVTAGTGG